MTDRHPLRATSFSRPLPEKKYFKIGEVASLVGVEPHVLRYWETQFSQLRPHKARSGHRLYRRREVEVLLAIRELLHVQRFTIAGARQALRQQPGLAHSLLPTAAAQPGDTLPPMAADVTLDDDNGADGLDGAYGESADAVESVDVEGLDGEDLELAMEAQRHDQRTAGIVAVDVERLDDGRARPLTHTRPAATPLATAPRTSALDLGGRAIALQARLVEDALREARGLLAFLDDLDARAAGRAV